MNKLALHLKCIGNFSPVESVQVLFEMLSRKITGIKPSYNFQARSAFIFLLGGNARVKKEGALNRISLSTPHHPFSADFYIRRKTTDIVIFKEILYDGGYRYIKELADRLQLDVRYIIDAGANIGTATVYMKAVFPQARIVCIEPETGNFNVLKRNIEVNHLQNVTPVQAGLWSRESLLRIRQGFRGGVEKELSFFVEEVGTGDEASADLKGVSVASIKNQFGFPRVDVLKIDIEGAERFLFASLESTAEILRDVRILAIEVHEEVMDKWLLVGYLEKLGFRQITFGEILYAYRP